MNDSRRLPIGLIRFAGGVLVVAVLFWGRPVIVPVVLAVLLSFVLTPVVSTLQKLTGRVGAVLVVVFLTFALVGLAGWAVTGQMASIVHDLPAYRTNIRQKIKDIRAAGKGGPVDTIKDTVADIKHEMHPEQTGTSAAPLVVESSEAATLWSFPTALGSWLEPLTTAGLIIILVIFMLLEREELRNRIIKLLGYGTLTVTTRALDEAGSRISRYLLRQSLLNLVYGVAVGFVLFVLGVPYAVFWGCLSAGLRYVPLVGPWIAAFCVLVVSFGVFDGWLRPLSVGLVFIGIELVTNMVLEPLFYAGAAGISQVGLLVALAFWTWLWGGVGLLVATPLTVCLVVMGKYVPGLEFLATLMADDPELQNDVTYYQRLLAGDQAEAAEIIDRHLANGEAEAVYDELMLPALNYAERDRVEGRLSVEEEAQLVRLTDGLLADLGETRAASEGDGSSPQPGSTALGCPIEGEADTVALRMLTQLLPAPLHLKITTPAMTASEIIALARRENCRVVCIADLPPSAPTKSRYLARRLHAALPDVKIVVGRWGPPQFADEGDKGLSTVGVSAVATRLVDARDLMREWLSIVEPAEDAIAANS